MKLEGTSASKREILSVDRSSETPQISQESHIPRLCSGMGCENQTGMLSNQTNPMENVTGAVTTTMSTKPSGRNGNIPNGQGMKRELITDRPTSQICDLEVRDRSLHTFFDCSARVCSHGMLHPLSVGKLRIISLASLLVSRRSSWS